MSRLLVKGLPKDVTEDRLRDVFSQYGEITDVKLLRFMEVRRQFAFIGFRREEEAHEAIKYFNNFNKSFIDASQISVEVARKDGVSLTYRPSQGKGNEKGATSSNRISRNGYANGDKMKMREPEVGDPAEFQSLVGVSERGKSKIWSQGTSNEQKKRCSDTENSRKKKVVALSVGASDVGYFESRVKKNLPHSDSGSDSDEPDDADGCLIVINMPCTATNQEILEHFSEFGELSEVHLFKRHAYILYSSPESALRAMKTLSNKFFQGRLLSIFPAGNLSKTLKKKTEAYVLPDTVSAPCDTAPCDTAPCDTASSSHKDKSSKLQEKTLSLNKNSKIDAGAA